MKPKILCVIGARGGSKRLKNKNIQEYTNKLTLIEWAIMNALHSEYINEIVVDSEDNKILEIARGYAVKRHQREPSLSDDNVSLYIPVKRVLEDYPEYNIIVILQVDNPVENHEILDRCIETFLAHEDVEEVSTFHNNRRTGTVRVIKRDCFFIGYPTANIYSVEDRPDFVDIHTLEDLNKARQYLTDKPHDTFQVSNKIHEPIEYNTRMIYNHFKRYYEAVKILNIGHNDIVVDASCGQGYGSYILSQNAKAVYGLDINEKHLMKAKEHYALPNIFFETYEQFFTKEHENIDTIVCIETLEHMAKKELSLFIPMLLRQLREHGSMFITVPLGDDEPSSYNKYHLNEPSFETLEQLFFPYFNQRVISINTYVDSFNKEVEYCVMSLYGKKGEKTDEQN